MSKSAPFNLIANLFAPVWESSPKYKGTRYRATGQDLREAKVFLEMNSDIFEGDGIIDFQEHAMEYLKSNWDGWEKLKHPCCGLLRNYNTFAPKKVFETVKRKRMIHCLDCNHDHGINDPCPQKEEHNAKR